MHPRKSFQTRLLLAFLGLFILVQTLFFFALDQIHRKNAHSQIEKELLVGSQVVQQSLAQRSELLVRGASVFSRDYAFQKTFFSSDTATIRSAIRSLQHRIDADLMMIIDLDEDYTVLSDTNLQGFEQKPFPHPELLTKAEATGEPFSALIDIKNKLYFVAIVPLLTPEPSAWFCAGFMVDNQMAKGIKMMISSEVTFLNQGRNDLFRIPATTFPGDQSAIFLKLMNEPTIDKSFISRQLDEDWVSVIQPVPGSESVRMLLQRPLAELLSPYYELRKRLLSLSILGAIITLIIGRWIAASVTRPVRLLAEKARQIRDGHYGETVAIHKEDEIGDLAKSFNAMTKGLADRDRVRSLLGKVVSREIADELLSNKQTLLGGETRKVTILFSDVRDFTTISENLDPQQLLTIINRYLSAMSQVIENNGGVIDKFIGDAIMALYGAPVTHADDVDRALVTSLQMIEALDVLNQEFLAEGLPTLRIGIGINTDIVVAGNMGSEERMNYTVIGDGVNLAARLESETKKQGCSIIISEECLAETKNLYQTEYLGEVTVKGRSQATRIHRLDGNIQKAIE